MAHPTGRMIGVREGVPLDLDRVFARAAERQVAMEINAQPERSDLSDAHARLAREKGVRLLIDTDAHSVAQLDCLRFGVFAARRAGLAREDVLNALPFSAFREATRRQAKRSAAAPRGPASAAGGTAAAGAAGKGGRRKR